ncbi:MAG: DUF2007 domain-containing protein [Armatimonadota bacterium]
MNGNDSDTSLVQVYRAPTETLAYIVKGVLEDEGIEASLKSLQIPWYDGIMRMGEGYWGDVLVLEGDANRAREIIKSYEDRGNEANEV